MSTIWKVTMFTFYTNDEDEEIVEYDEFKIGLGYDFGTMQDFEQYREEVMRLLFGGGNTDVHTKCTFTTI